MNEKKTDKLKSSESFLCKNPQSFLFAIVIGGDGSSGTSTSILVSFLNFGERIASSAE